MRKLLLPFCLSGLIIATFYLFLSRNNHSGLKFEKPSIGASIADKSNKYARSAFETRKLVNPSTGKIPGNIRSKELAFKANLKSQIQDTSTANYIVWSPRGPYNIGGRTRAFGIDIRDTNVMIAGGASGGIWKSTNGGASWEQKNIGADNLSITCLVQDQRPGLQDLWYYGTGEGHGSSQSASGAYYLGNGVYMSTDNGNTWNSLSATASNTPTSFDQYWDIVWDIALDPSNEDADEIYVATLGRLYFSEDGGESFQNVLGSSSSNYSYYTEVEIDNNGHVYSAFSSDGPTNESGIWRSADGQNFVNITPSNFPETYNRFIIKINPHNENEVYFLGHTPGYGKENHNWQGSPEYHSLWKYTYISGDGSGSGGTWEDLSENLPAGPNEFDDFSAQSSYNLCINFDLNDANTIYIGGTNLYRSTSAFTDSLNTQHFGGYDIYSFIPDYRNYPNHHPDQHGIFIHPDQPNVMYNTNDGGIYKTNNLNADSIAWTSLNNGYMTTQFYSIAMDPSTISPKIIGGLQDNGTLFSASTSTEQEWTMPFPYDGGFCAVENGEDHYYFATQAGRIVKGNIDDNGILQGYQRIDPEGGENYLFINPFVLDVNDNNLMYTIDSNKIWRNDDLMNISLNNEFLPITQGWTMFSDTLPISGIEFTTMAISEYPANILYLGTSSRRVYKVEAANSGDPELTEITSGPPVLFPGAYVNDIAIDPHDANRFGVIFSNYSVYSAFFTTDGGITYEKIAGNLEANSQGTGDGPSLRCMAVIPVDGQKAYLMGTSVGVFITDSLKGTDTEWIPIGENSIQNAIIEDIQYRETDGKVLVATHGNGVFETNIVDLEQFVSIENKKHNIEMTVTPNSSNQLFYVQLKNTNAVSYQIYNTNGQLISSKNVSGNNFHFVSQNWAPGIYHLTVNTGLGRKNVKISIQ